MSVHDKPVRHERHSRDEREHAHRKLSGIPATFFFTSPCRLSRPASRALFLSLWSSRKYVICIDPCLYTRAERTTHAHVHACTHAEYRDRREEAEGEANNVTIDTPFHTFPTDQSTLQPSCLIATKVSRMTMIHVTRER